MTAMRPHAIWSIRSPAIRGPVAAQRIESWSKCMPDQVTAERVAIMAAAARVPIQPGAEMRIAQAVGPTAARFAALPFDVALETEPSTFVVVQRAELDP